MPSQSPIAPRYAALKQRNFVLLWVGLIVSNVGTWIQEVAGAFYGFASVAFVDAQTGWAVGHGGTILRHIGTYPTRAFLPLLNKGISGGW